MTQRQHVPEDGGPSNARSNGTTPQTTTQQQQVSGNSGPSNGAQQLRPDVEDKSLAAREIYCRRGNVLTNIITPAHEASSPFPSSSTLDPATKEESQTILTTIQAVQQQVTQQSKQINAMYAQRDTGEHQTQARTPQLPETYGSQAGCTLSDQGSDLMTVLENLKDLISKEGLFLFSKEACSMIKTLDKVFEVFEDFAAMSPVTHESGKRKRSESAEADDTLPRPHIKRARGHLVNSQCVTVGHLGKTKFDSNDWQLTGCLGPLSAPRLEVRDYSRLTKSFDLNINPATIKLTCKKRRWKQLPNTEDYLSELDTVVDVYTSVLEVISRTPSWDYKIIVTLMQQATPRGTELLRSTMIYSAIIPDDAPIWQCIENDDVSGMRSLFEQGEASVSDCNSDGESLLGVS